MSAEDKMTWIPHKKEDMEENKLKGKKEYSKINQYVPPKKEKVITQEG